ncbi:hypothetical protein E8E11_006414 [Didymella keratinophila]|nr:hypothetical protein E8E11_006414 [Didymella keratinophila]
MGVVSRSSESAYLAFFDSIMDEDMFSAPFEDFQWIFSSDPDPPFENLPSIKNGELFPDPNERLPSPPIIAPPNPTDVADEIENHWVTLIEKSRKLKNRLMQERAKIDVLKEQFEAGQSSDKALYDYIVTRVAWLQSISKNHNLSVQDHKTAQGLHGSKILGAMMERIEQRQRAVEVALQQGSSEHVDNSGQDVAAGVKRRDTEEVTEMLPEDRFFRMEDANLEMLELDFPFYTSKESVDARQNAQPIGMFAVPKPTKRQK